MAAGAPLYPGVVRTRYAKCPSGLPVGSREHIRIDSFISFVAAWKEAALFDLRRVRWSPYGNLLVANEVAYLRVAAATSTFMKPVTFAAWLAATTIERYRTERFVQNEIRLRTQRGTQSDRNVLYKSNRAH